ncbi:MAG TPA: undecaprenyl-diphosphate phosphatase [Methylomirabilota bacterium]|nr:undecaprenyl-diphosphate phosphatase [Methylomirabilota bacterium]
MNYAHAVVLGLVQGLTEFLPVSSSGHLILVPHVFGWRDQGLAVDAALHLGTLAALVAYFRGELSALATGALSRRLLLVLAAASVPAGLAGLLFGQVIATTLRMPLLIALTTAFWGGAMWAADRRAPPPARPGADPLERIGWGQSLAIGLAQAVALVPGTSRSGITITAGLLGGLDRATAARFSFLLGIPVTAGAGLLKALQLVETGVPAGQGAPLAAAILTSFASGWLAVWFLVRYLKRGSLLPFVLYRFVLSAAILFVAL